jgi:mannosyltransferase
MLWLFLKATERGGSVAKFSWVAYTFLSALGTYLFIYLILLNIAFGLWLLFAQTSLGERLKRERLRWAVSLGVQVAVTALILWRANSQQHQIHWLPPVDWRTVPEVLAGQVFWMAPAMAMVANGIILVYILGTQGRSRSSRSTDALLTLSVSIPTAIVLVYSLVKTTIYDARYFSYTAPMVAILLAAAIEKLFARRIAFAVTLVLVLLAAPAYIEFRTPSSKLTDWNSVATAVSRVKEPGDAILYGDYADPTPTVSRIHLAYPAAFDGLTDLSLRKPADKTWKLFDARKPVLSTASEWQKFHRIVLIEDGTHSAADLRVMGELKKQGFEQSRLIRLEPETVLVFARGN